MLSKTDTSSDSQQTSSHCNSYYSWEKTSPTPRLVFHFEVGWSNARNTTHRSVCSVSPFISSPSGGGGRKKSKHPTSNILENADFWTYIILHTSRCTHYYWSYGSHNFCLLVCHQSDTCTGLHQTVTYAQIQLRSEVSASSLILVTIVTHPSAQALTAGNHADFYFT